MPLNIRLGGDLRTLGALGALGAALWQVVTHGLDASTAGLIGTAVTILATTGGKPTTGTDQEATP